MQRGIMLEDPGFRDNFGRAPMDREAMLKRFREMTFEEHRAEWQKDHPQWSDEMLDLMAQTKHLLSPECVRMQWVNVPWQETLKQVRCPVLLFTADVALGALATPEAVAQAKEICPQLEHVHTPGVGHLIRYDSPEPYTSATKAFLARIYGL